MAAVNNGTSSGGLPRWCPQREVWVGGWALNPCLLETTGPAAAGFVLMVWALVGLLKPLKMAVKLRHEGRSLKVGFGCAQWVQQVVSCHAHQAFWAESYGNRVALVR